MEKIQLLIFPGLGGDKRMAYPQLELPYDVIALDLIEMRSDESIAEYAQRFVESLPIDTARQLWLAGYSFGSAIAQELCSVLHAEGLIIIGGLRSGKDFRWTVRLVGSLAPFFPPIFFDLISPIAWIGMKYFSGISDHDVDLNYSMYRKTSKKLFRRGLSAIIKWSGKSVTVPTLRIHG